MGLVRGLGKIFFVAAAFRRAERRSTVRWIRDVHRSQGEIYRTFDWLRTYVQSL